MPTLTAYAVDASIYRMTPKAVVLAEHEADIDAVVRFAVAKGIPSRRAPPGPISPVRQSGQASFSTCPR